MKLKKTIASVLTMFLVLGLGLIPLAYAQEPATTTSTEATGTEAGVTPNSWFYSMDRLVEQVQLFLAQGEVAKAAVLEKLAEERLSEAEEMADADQQALAQEMIAEFTATLKAITENIEAAAVVTGSTPDDAKLAEVVASVEALRTGYQQRINELLVKLGVQLAEDPNDAIDEAGDTAGAVDAIGDEEQYAETTPQTTHNQPDQDASAIKAAIIKAYNLDAGIFDQLYAAGLNFGQARMVAILIGRTNLDRADADKVTVEQVLALRVKGWGHLKKELGLKRGDLGLACGHILKEAGVKIHNEDQDKEDADGDQANIVKTTTKTSQPKHQEGEKNEHGDGLANGHDKKDK